MKVLAIIPARYASTRFPGKPLVDIAGKSMIKRVVERVQQCASISQVVVATDDERIFSHVQEFGATAVMTRSDHPSGTDRCLEAYQKINGTADCIINVQGDEPFVDMVQLEALIQLISQPGVSIATLAKRISDTATLFDPSKVKVVINARHEALYFSRQAIPFFRNEVAADWHKLHTYYKHLGLYAYTPKKLEEICSLKPSSLERAESLEQLRWMENGQAIHVALTEIESPAIDTPEDLQFVIERYFSDSKR
jgi:3-deoxy-manno-octulosonate cytidylyltransferase (CMP-KDO synthetase)